MLSFDPYQKPLSAASYLSLYCFKDTFLRFDVTLIT